MKEMRTGSDNTSSVTILSSPVNLYSFMPMPKSAKS